MGGDQPNVNRCGQGEGGSKITVKTKKSKIKMCGHPLRMAPKPILCEIKANIFLFTAILSS